MPVAGKQVDTRNLAELIRSYQSDFALTAWLENVHSMPREGVSSAHKFGRCWGAVDGVLGALGIATNLVTPQKWKRDAGLIGRDKDAGRLLALRLFPSLAGELKRKKDHGRADALLIARYGMLAQFAGRDNLSN
jgi:crossover junction endodeoxyribonuclease RuvC